MRDRGQGPVIDAIDMFEKFQREQELVSASPPTKTRWLFLKKTALEESMHKLIVVLVVLALPATALAIAPAQRPAPAHHHRHGLMHRLFRSSHRRPVHKPPHPLPLKH
jgi:hypothetical protein